MADDLVNLAVESGRDIVDDDAEAALTLKNTNASGTALALNASAGGVGLDVDTTTGIGVDIDSTSGTGVDVSTAGTAGVFRSTATEGTVLDVSHGTAIGSPTVAPLLVATSAASGALIEFNSALISTASLTVHAGAIPVKLTGEDKVVYLVGYEIA